MKRIITLISIGLFIASCSKETKINEEHNNVQNQEQVLRAIDISNGNPVFIPVSNKSQFESLSKQTTKISIKKKEGSESNISAASTYPELNVISSNGNSYTFQGIANMAQDCGYDYYFTNYTKGISWYLGSSYNPSITFTTTIDCMDEYFLTVQAWPYDPNFGTCVPVSLSSESFFRKAPSLSVSGVGNEGQGADVLLYDVNKNGVLDMIFMAIDNPAGSNSFKYRVAYDINSDGYTTNISSIFTVSGVGNECHGGGMAISDIDGNGTDDLIMMYYDNPSGANSFVYKIGFNLNTSGGVSSWSSSKVVSGVGNEGNGAKISFRDIDGNGVKDIILMAYDNPAGPNSFVYKIGFNVNTSGVASYWSSSYTIAGIGNEADGAGLEIADIDGNGQLDMILMAYDAPSGPNYFVYKVLYNLNSAGQHSSISSIREISGLGDLGHGASIRISDIDNNGTKDLILMAYDNPSGANSFKYYVSKNLSVNGLSSTFVCN